MIKDGIVQSGFSITKLGYNTASYNSSKKCLELLYTIRSGSTGFAILANVTNYKTLNLSALGDSTHTGIGFLQALSSLPNLNGDAYGYYQTNASCLDISSLSNNQYLVVCTKSNASDINYQLYIKDLWLE